VDRALRRHPRKADDASAPTSANLNIGSELEPVVINRKLDGRMKMNRYLVAILGLLALTGLPAVWANVVNGTATTVPPYQARGAAEFATVGPLVASLQSKPVVARIHADWCPACKATQPTIDALRAAYTGRINFVQFDVTNAKTAAVSQALARKLGLERFYEGTKAATSTVAVIDPQNGKIYATLYNDGNLGDYEAAVNDVLRALKVGSK
jgi:thiol-disulfide isomerase/thioredoxin